MISQRVPWSRLATLRQLRIFGATAEAGSTGAAARRLRLSQPATSHALSRLEQALGTRFVDRTPRGSQLTPEGHILQSRVRRMEGYLRTGVGGLLDAADDMVIERSASALSSTQVVSHLAVAAAGSFQAAAAALGLSVPAVHRAGHSLELLLGARLYRRSGHRVGVSEAGGRLANALRLALAEIDQAQDDIDAVGTRGAARVRIGVLPLTPSAIIGRAIGELLRRLPDLEMQVEEGPYERLAPQLRDGRLDMIFGAIRPERADPEFVTEPLIDDPYVVVGRAEHPLVDVGIIDITRLSDQIWLLPPIGSPRRMAIETLLATLPNRPRTILQTSSESILFATLLASDCLTLTPRSQVQSFAPRDAIRQIPSIISMAQRSLGFTLRTDWVPTRAQTAMLEFVEKNVCKLIMSQ